MRKYSTLFLFLILPALLTACFGTGGQLPPPADEQELTAAPTTGFELVGLGGEKATWTPTIAPTPTGTIDWQSTAIYLVKAPTSEALKLQEAYITQQYEIASTQAANAATYSAQDWAVKQTKISAEVAAIQTQVAAQVQYTTTMAAFIITQTAVPVNAEMTQAAQELAARQAELDIINGQATSEAEKILLEKIASEQALAQQLKTTEIYNNGLQATQTADAPLMVVRQRMQMTAEVQAATAAASQEAKIEQTSAYYSSAGKMFVAIIILGFGLTVLVLIRHYDSKQKIAIMQAEATAARQRVLDSRAGTIFAGNQGAMNIANAQRPIYDMSYKPTVNSAQRADQLPAAQEEPVDKNVSKAGRFLIDAAGASGDHGQGWFSNLIPRWDAMGMSSASEWTEITNWLVDCGALDKQPGKGTYVKEPYKNIRGVYQALQNLDLQPPSPDLVAGGNGHQNG